MVEYSSGLLHQDLLDTVVFHTFLMEILLTASPIAKAVRYFFSNDRMVLLPRVRYLTPKVSLSGRVSTYFPIQVSEVTINLSLLTGTSLILEWLLSQFQCHLWKGVDQNWKHSSL